jgi:predicted amidohydrolase
VKIGLVQYNPVWEDKKKNREKLNGLLSKEFSNEKLLIFPEMTLTGFTMKSKEFAETLDGESFNYYAEAASKYNGHVLAGVIEIKDNRYYNSLLHVSPDGKLINVYRKIHPFSYSTEDKHYTRGTETITTNVEDWNVGLSICYDLRFPELYRHYGKEKSELIIVIANWPDTRIEHWRTLLKARAIENQCYVAGVNRVGKDLKLNYNGYSSVFDPMGNELTTQADTEKILTAEISLKNVEETRTKLPFLNDIYLI